ncbi:MAG: DedA family protein [Bacteriovorax sp.]|nr:DedA family protein [Bacteriovorax sp.]
MDILHTLFDFLLHFDVHLDLIIRNYHSWTYLILFLIIFVETGVIIMPFLPGDSLLFAIGALAARGTLDFWSISFLLLLAAFLGDTINYSVGKFIGPKIFAKEKSLFFNKKHLDRAHLFYKEYGAKTIILARFVPIVRTFAPFVAGIGEMKYQKFLAYNIIGATLWIFIFIPLGYFFGNLEFVRRHFELVMVAIIFLSLLPGVMEFCRGKWSKKR